MSRYAQPASIAATAIVSIAIGYGAATFIASRNQDDKPIINPTAWEETAPQLQAQPVSLTNTAKTVPAAKCSPWEITDVAMEEVLDEMIARGWRPPNQGDAIAAMGVASISTDDPNAPMPYRRNWLASDADAATLSETTDTASVPAPNDPAGGPPQPAAIDQPPPAAPAPADS